MKIGLLATSGLRVLDRRLIELGLRMPGIVQRAQTIASLPSLGLLYLAAATPAEHELHYWETSPALQESDPTGQARPPQVILPPEALTCDLVAISTLSAQAGEAYALADQLRAAGVQVALGGLHASVLPQEALAHADHVVIGEGEPVWPELIRAVAAGAAPRVWNSRDYPPVDVSQLPLPRYDLLGQRRYLRYTVQTSRGCPWRCDFCASNVMLGLPYRKRPPAGIRRDIEKLIELYQRPFIEFADDNTFVDKAWGKRLCQELSPLGIHWFAETDWTIAQDSELLHAMRAAGCRQVLIGFESPDPSALVGIELRADFKARDVERQRQAIQTIQDHGIAVNACFVLGLDRHDSRIFEQVLDFVGETKPFDVQVTVLTPFPGTPLYERLLAAGRILQPGRWDLCTLFDVNFLPQQMSPEELRQGFYWLVEQIYHEAAVHARQAHFFDQPARVRRRS